MITGLLIQFFCDIFAEEKLKVIHLIKQYNQLLWMEIHDSQC